MECYRKVIKLFPSLQDPKHQLASATGVPITLFGLTRGQNSKTNLFDKKFTTPKGNIFHDDYFLAFHLDNSNS